MPRFISSSLKLKKKDIENRIKECELSSSAEEFSEYDSHSSSSIDVADYQEPILCEGKLSPPYSFNVHVHDDDESSSGIMNENTNIFITDFPNRIGTQEMPKYVQFNTDVDDDEELFKVQLNKDT